MLPPPMASRRRYPNPRPLRAAHARVGVAVALTPTAGRQLKQQAAADGRSVASCTAWLIAQDLDRPSRRPRASVRTKSSNQLVRLRIALVLPIPRRNRLRRKAAAQMRSVSGYVGRVIVEALSRR